VNKKFEEIRESGYLKEMECCRLCEWRCGVDRLAGELGTCRMAIPIVASCQLHPAPPRSYTIFTAGCNFRCLGCQNYRIAHHPDQVASHLEGFIEPGSLASESLAMINSAMGRMLGADRIFFSGGEPTIHLPYIEEIVREAREINLGIKVNFDTNGFLTEESLRRVIRFTTSITYDLKALHDHVHRAVTGAPLEPVLRNAEIIAREAEDKLWEYRILVIPEIVDEREVAAICEFIAEINPSLPVCFLAFRPNFVLDKHHGAPIELMKKAVEIARMSGLEKVHWSGMTDVRGHDISGIIQMKDRLKDKYDPERARMAGSFALYMDCQTHPRNCGRCPAKHNCNIKRYQPLRRT
jgi:pyruvate formate lyase activating enzyme